MPWLKGVPFSEEHMRRLKESALDRKGIPRSLEVRLKISNSLKGKKGHPASEEQKRRQSIAMKARGTTPPNTKGISTWNKGLTKETSPLIAKMVATRKDNPWPGLSKMLGWNKGLTKETDTRVARNGLAISRALNVEDIKHRLSIARKIPWSDPKRKEELIKKTRMAAKIKPNKLELLLNSLLQSNFPDEWAYTGNGKLIIDGLVPDFANINGHKAVIEAFGDYWHKGQNPENRMAKYEKMGYQCLVFWEKDIKKNPALVIEQVRTLTMQS